MPTLLSAPACRELPELVEGGEAQSRRVQCGRYCPSHWPLLHRSNPLLPATAWLFSAVPPLHGRHS